MQFNIADFLPMLPWEGPPLPRFLGISWPWLQRGQSFSLPMLPAPKKYISSIEEVKSNPAPLASYSNEESWDIEWTDDGLPRKITVSRHARRA